MRSALLVSALAAAALRTADAEAPPAPFQPSELSIGEPLPLPGPPSPNPVAPRSFEPRPSPLPALPPPPSPTPTPLAGRSPARLPETGWLGCVADDSLIPGRLTVVEVSAHGPAALAGIQPRDTLLAIDGTPLKNADGWAAALAAIPPGKTVRIAVGRPLGGGPGTPERIAEVVVTATARPPRPEASQWQASTKTTAVTAAQEPPAAFVPPRPTPSPQPRPGVHALPASRAGIPPGAVIVALDHQPVRSPEDLTRLVAGCPVGRAVSLEYVLLGGVQRRAEVELKPLDAPLRQALMAR